MLNSDKCVFIQLLTKNKLRDKNSLINFLNKKNFCNNFVGLPIDFVN